MARPQRSSGKIRPADWGERRRAAGRQGSSRSERRAPPDPDAPITARRKWLAAGVGTLLIIPIFSLVVAAIVAADEESDLEANPGLLVTIAMILVPVTLYLVARLSRKEKALMSAAWGTTTAMLVTAALSMAWWEPVSPMVAGLGAGGILTLRRHPETTTAARVAAVVLAVLYTGLMVSVLPQLSVAIAPILPLTSIAGADGLMARRAADR